MLHHPSVKTFGFAINRITVGIKPRVPNARPARHLASQPRNRQATLPIIFLLHSQRVITGLTKTVLGTNGRSG